MWEFMVNTANSFWAGAGAAWEIIEVLGTWVLMLYPIIFITFVGIMIALWLKYKVEKYIEEREKQHGKEE